MKILITGGAGYIGTSLVKMLVGLQQIENIIIYDNLMHKNYGLFFAQSIKPSEKISYIKEQGISVGTLYSNGLHFHKVGVERVLNCGISHLGISLATLDRAAYQAIYRVNKYDDLLNNLKDLLISFRDADKSKISVKSISIEFRLDRPLSELKLLKDYKEYIDKYLSPGVIIGGYNEFDSWSGAIEDNDLLPGMRLIYNTRSIGLPCYRLFNIQVGVNGDIRLCGCRINPKLIKQNSFVDDPLYLGNIKQSSIIDLYNGYKSKEIVKSFLKGNAPDECNMCVWSGHKKTYIRPLL